MLNSYASNANEVLTNIKRWASPQESLLDWWDEIITTGATSKKPRDKKDKKTRLENALKSY